MATEAYWTVGTTFTTETHDGEVTQINGDLVDGDCKTDTYNTIHGAQILYAIKEALVNTGCFSVVSSSVRINYTQAQTRAQMQWQVSDTDLWTLGDTATENKLLFRKIYPGKVISNSGYPALICDTGYTGRAWCLLKWVAGGNVGNDAAYHILLDYAGADAAANTPTVFAGGDLVKPFGKSIGIYVFPNYGDSDSDIGGAPTALKRPRHVKEVGRPNKETADSVAYTNANPVVINGTNTGNTGTNTAVNVNFLFGSEAEGGDVHSVIIFGSSGPSVEKFIFSFSKIADLISITPNVYPGNKMFMLWSNYNPVLQSKPLGPTEATTAVGGATSTILDSSNREASIFYYRKYNPNDPSTKYIVGYLNTALPYFISRTTVNNTARLAALFKTTYNNGITADGTYVEWPLPLIEQINTGTTFRYIGRMLDIKAGPLTAPSGLFAKQSPSDTVYDRLFFDGLWLPYNDQDLITL